MTLPREVSAALVSEPADLSSLPDGLIAPAAEIFDKPAVRAALWRALDGAEDERAVRKATVDLLGQARDKARAVVAQAFARRPYDARQVTQSYTWITDCLVTLSWEVATERLHRRPTPTEAEKIAVIAVGGYGRGEMAPYSDVDLLFLTPYKIAPWAENVIESMLYIFWDLKLKVGHASRTIKDCLRLGAEDYTIRTAMLEHRFLTGHAPLAEELDRRLWSELFEGSARDFVEATAAE